MRGRGDVVRVLFTSAGRRVELTRCFRRAAEALGMRAEIHACDLAPQLSAACLDADATFGVPRCTDPDYVDLVLAHCESRGIDLLVPTIDTELEFFSRARDRFAAIGTTVHVSAPEVIDVVRDKARTVASLAAVGVPVPRTARVDEIRDDWSDWVFPVFVKPTGGSASRGIEVLRSASELRADYPEPMLVQELLRGPEYTVNVYIDAEGELRSAIPHRRLSVRAGEVEKGVTVRDPRLSSIASGVATALRDAGGDGPWGVLCFQLLDDPHRGPRVFEINARFGGGYPLADQSGGRFAESVLARTVGRAECATDDWRSDVTMVRYDSAIFRG